MCFPFCSYLEDFCHVSPEARMVESQQQLAGSWEPLPASFFSSPSFDCLFQLRRVSTYIACWVNRVYREGKRAYFEHLSHLLQLWMSRNASGSAKYWFFQYFILEMGKASFSVAEEMQWEEESAPWVIPGRGIESQWCSQITVTQFYGNISKVKMNMRISLTNASQRWLASTCICQVEGDCTPKNFNLPEFTMSTSLRFLNAYQFLWSGA